ncbi:MAG TPA: adenylate/guanylate cyclase domain-containing protein [Gammaproteobacteria bacterium]
MQLIPPLLRTPFAAIAALFIALTLLEYATDGLLSNIEHPSSDFMLRQIAKHNPPDPDIVIVDIDERSLELMAPLEGRYPWARSVHAELVEGIARQQPKAIVFDILFSDSDLLRPDADAYLAEVAQSHDNLFFPFVRLDAVADASGLPLDEYGAQLGFQRTPGAAAGSRAALLLPMTSLLHNLGAINFSADEDGVGRHYPLYLQAHGWRLPSLPARVATALGLPLPDHEILTLNWHGTALSYPRRSYYDIYHDLTLSEPQRSAHEFTDKIVIIGATATGLHDLRATPLSSQHPAVEILATAIDNLKNQDPLREVPVPYRIALTLLLLGLVFLAFARNLGPLPIAIALLLATLLLSALSYLQLQQRWLLAVVTPLLITWGYFGAAALYAYWQERKVRERSVQIFSRFLDPRVVKELVARGESALSLKSESRQLTVLFSDIRGFTTLSEQRTAEQVVELLNHYFSQQVQAVFHHNGTMDKFIGDAIMAFWGAPVDDPQQADNAVDAALEMSEVLIKFRDSLPEELRDFDIGIGIHSGPAVVGFIGSENRLDYTAIGDTVNLASRIEGQTKGVARVLVSGETRALCSTRFDFVDHGSYKVKGRSQEVRLFEPVRRN